MFKKEVVCLEIGSSKLRVIVASEGVNNTLLIKELATREYDGYFQGEFVDEKHLAPALFDLFNSIDFKKKKYFKKLYISLPSEMCKVINVTSSVDIEGIGKASKADLENLKFQAVERAKIDEGEIVSVSPICYYVDDNQLSNPLAVKGRLLTADFSIIISEKATIEKLNDIFADLGFINVEYVCEALCGALGLVGEEERKDGAVLIDVGHLSTSVTYIKNNGISSLTSFSIGGGHITNDLSEAFDLVYEDAERLKREVVISLAAEALDYYDLPSVEGKIIRLPQTDANAVVSYRLEAIASAINQCLIMQGINLSSYLPVYLIGGGVSKIKGGKDFLAKCLGRNITLGKSSLPGKDKPDEAIIFAIADYALKNCE